jgi:hypothetical protein
MAATFAPSVPRVCVCRRRHRASPGRAALRPAHGQNEAASSSIGAFCQTHAVAAWASGKAVSALRCRRRQQYGTGERVSPRHGKSAPVGTSLPAAAATVGDTISPVSVNLGFEKWLQQYPAVWQVLQAEVGFSDELAHNVIQRSLYRQAKVDLVIPFVFRDVDALRSRLHALRDVLDKYGAPFAKVVASRPDLVTSSPSTIDLRLSKLRSALGVSHDFVGSMLARYSGITFTPVEVVEQNFELLSERFGSNMALDMLARFPGLVGRCTKDTLIVKIDAVVNMCAPVMDQAAALECIRRRPQLILYNRVADAVRMGAQSTGLPYKKVGIPLSDLF